MSSNPENCPKCRHTNLVKSGFVGGRQRFRCKDCGYHFSVEKQGKAIDPYYIIKAIQLYLEGLSYREIERILGVSHVTISNYVRMYLKDQSIAQREQLSYRIYAHSELAAWVAKPENLINHGCIITELGDKFMLISWKKRF